VNGFIPFVSGNSMCPGRLFAKNAIKICIIMFLQFIHCQIVPIEKRQRQGMGVSHPFLCYLLFI